MPSTGKVVNTYFLSTGSGINVKAVPTPVFLPGESCGQRSLVGCCPWGHTVSDMTEPT